MVIPQRARSHSDKKCVIKKHTIVNLLSGNVVNICMIKLYPHYLLANHLLIVKSISLYMYTYVFYID